ncbi:GNAT family N-acetyltransferase [Chloroflexota bacterium]
MITGTMIKLRHKKLADALDDYNWQTDPELAELDALTVPTITFRQYLSDHTAELLYSSATKRQFGIETINGKHIGNCGYYAVDEAKGEAELGIMIGDRDYWNKGYGNDAVNTLIGHILTQTNLNRIHLKTLVCNNRAQKCFQKCGFTPCGQVVRDGHNFILMELHRNQWQERQKEQVP